jgi:ComF family protein
MPVVSVQVALTSSKKLTVFAVGSYQEPLKSLIMTKSWSDPLGSTYLGQLVWQMTPLKHLYFDYLIPIPLHWTRQAWRGFNQAERMAQVICQKSGKPVIHLLKRTKRTVFQSTISKDERPLNVKDAFGLTAHSNEFEGKHLVIVDDLMTTGATLHQAARALLPLKPASIIAVVACRVV